MIPYNFVFVKKEQYYSWFCPLRKIQNFARRDSDGGIAVLVTNVCKSHLKQYNL